MKMGIFGGSGSASSRSGKVTFSRNGPQDTSTLTLRLFKDCKKGNIIWILPLKKKKRGELLNEKAFQDAVRAELADMASNIC